MRHAEIAIRRLGEADAARFRAIRLDALTHHPHDFGASVADEAAAELDAFADMLRRNAVYGALAGDRLLGWSPSILRPARNSATRG